MNNSYLPNDLLIKMNQTGDGIQHSGSSICCQYMFHSYLQWMAHTFSYVGQCLFNLLCNICDRQNNLIYKNPFVQWFLSLHFCLDAILSTGLYSAKSNLCPPASLFSNCLRQPAITMQCHSSK